MGLPIGAWTYNVSFSNQSFAVTFPGGLPTPPPAAAVSASAVIDAIGAVLNAANVHYAGPTGFGSDYFWVPVSESCPSGSACTCPSGSACTIFYSVGVQVNNGAADTAPSCWALNDLYDSTVFGPYPINIATNFAVLTPIPIAQTIMFPNIAPQNLGTEAEWEGFEVPVSSNSGPVTLMTVPSPSMYCTVVPNTTIVKVTAIGTCELQASVEGNSYYLPASATQSFTVNPAPPLTYSANLLNTVPVTACSASGTPIIRTLTAGINNAGQVIGNSNCYGATNFYSNILWNGTTPTYVNLSPSYFNGWPTNGNFFPVNGATLSGINDAGYIVGSASYGYATLWQPAPLANGALASGLPFLPFNALSFPNNYYSYATAISSDGWVVGGATQPSSQSSVIESPVINATLWNGGSNPQYLGPLVTNGPLANGPTIASLAYGINSSHTIVGGGTVWESPNFAPTYLGSLSSSGGSSAVAISNDGWVVGSSYTQFIAGQGFSDPHPALWIGDNVSYGSPIDLEPLPNASAPGSQLDTGLPCANFDGGVSISISSTALAINSSHKIVGASAYFAIPPPPAPATQCTEIAHATFWDGASSTPTPLDLNSVIVSGLPLNLVLTTASGINNSGWISVDAIDINSGAQFAYLLVPTLASSVAAPQSISSGQTSTITAVTPNGIGPFTYQWYQGMAGDMSTPIVGATQSTLTTPGLATTTNYWVQITTASGVVEDSGTTKITVTPATATLSAALGSISVDGSGNYIASIAISNTGNASASSAVLSTASLVVSQSGKAVTTATSTPLPIALTGLAPGATVTQTLIFPASAGPPGALAALRWSLTNTAGSASGTLRLALP